MPELQVPVDNTIAIDQISKDLLYIRSAVETKSAEKPILYDTQLSSIDALLKSIDGKIVKQADVSKAVSTTDFDKLYTEVKALNVHTQNLENISIPFLVGFGLVIGVMCALIFSNFVRH